MSSAEKGLPLFLALDALPEVYVTEAELPEKQEKKPSLWERLNTNGWIAAAVSVVVALAVVTLIIRAGRGAGGPGAAGTLPATETDTTETFIRETVTPEPNVTEPVTQETGMKETEAPGTDAPETDLPETDAPETDAAETQTAEIGTEETDPSEKSPYAFVFGNREIIPLEGLMYFSGVDENGVEYEADGYGLSLKLTTMDDPPTVVLRADEASRLDFICRTGEEPGWIHLWAADGGVLAYGLDFSFLPDALRGKPGTYFVSVSIFRVKPDGVGSYTEGIRLIVEE